MDGAGKKLLTFMESAQQQLGGGVWLDMRAQMRSLDQSANNNDSHTNSSQEDASLIIETTVPALDYRAKNERITARIIDISSYIRQYRIIHA